MDIPTLALAKAYTDSQRLAYVVPGAKLTFDGDITGKEFLNETLVKISDVPVDLTSVTKCILTADPVIASAFGVPENMEYTGDGFTVSSVNILGIEAQQLSTAENMIAVSIPDHGLWGTVMLGTSMGFDEVDVAMWVSYIECAETIHPIDPKYIPAMDSVTLNSPNGTQFKITVDDTGALTATEVTP